MWGKGCSWKMPMQEAVAGTGEEQKLSAEDKIITPDMTGDRGEKRRSGMGPEQRHARSDAGEGREDVSG